MNISLIANFINTFLNTCVRNIPEGVRWLIVCLAAAGMFWFFALSINKAKDHDKKPIRVLFLILSFLCLGVLILYTSFRG
ncbi:MAG: hypothetical protein IJU58_02405 [Clostridia bacterium]|nr:hypothetical protein [Clostridia bacterium]